MNLVTLLLENKYHIKKKNLIFYNILALQECMLTHSFKEITTFGSHGDDFMLVVSPQPGTYPVRPDQVIPEAQKYFISMPKLQVGDQLGY